MSRKGIGFRKLAEGYHARYGLPLLQVVGGTPEDSAGWLKAQWGEALALRAAGVPVVGFAWGSLTDSVDWHHRAPVHYDERGPTGLFDLDRRPRPVSDAFRDLVERWGTILNVAPANQRDDERMKAQFGASA